MGSHFWSVCAIFVLLTGVGLYFVLDTNITPVVIPISPALDFTGKEKVHAVLSNMHKIDLFNYTGPESIVYFDGSLYTGVNEGVILRINESGIFEFTKLGPSDCKNKRECGRPLGMRLSPNSDCLIVVDAYLGVFNVSLIDGHSRKIFPTDDNVYQTTFLDDITFLSNGTFILSEASTNFGLDRLNDLIIEGMSTGRLLLIDPNTGKVHIVAENLSFPNGVQLQHNQTAFLFAESTTCRILRVPLDGSPITVFIDGLPGLPDNIRPSSKGGYWVPVSSIRSTFKGYIFVDVLNRWPYLRLIFGKIYTWLIDPTMKSSSSMLLHLNKDGKITDIFTDPENKIPNLTEVVEMDGVLYFGSFFSPYIGKLEIPTDLFG